MDGPLASSICTSTAFQVTQMWCTLTDKGGNALLISFFLNCFQDKEGTLENWVLAKQCYDHIMQKLVKTGKNTKIINNPMSTFGLIEYSLSFSKFCDYVLQNLFCAKKSKSRGNGPWFSKYFERNKSPITFWGTTPNMLSHQ